MQHKRTISNQEKKATSRENKSKSSKPPNLFTGNKIHTTIYHLASNSQRKHHSPPQKLIKQEKNQIKKITFPSSNQTTKSNAEKFRYLINGGAGQEGMEREARWKEGERAQKLGFERWISRGFEDHFFGWFKSSFDRCAVSPF